MKSHTVEKQEIILSIGMIVKNEEKVLERCLKSLQPLMKAVPSELIIADTGSTDSTVEIAKKYTDNVFHFEWINDFAAARNSTLNRAKGIWYFFIDADEYLDEDIHEIIDFFKIPELYNHYRCAQIMMRNYQTQEKEKYLSSMLPRFHRIKNTGDDIVQFEGGIHETISMRAPLGYFQTIIHHTGYCFKSKTQLQNKQERNLILMRKEYNETEHSKRYRIISLLLDGAKAYPDEMEKYVQEALDLIDENCNNEFSRGLFTQVILYYLNIKPLYALELCEKYFKSYPDSQNYVATVSVSMLKAQILFSLGLYEKSFDEYENYYKLYLCYKNEEMDINDCAFRTLPGLSEEEYIIVRLQTIDCLINLNKYNEAIEMFESIDAVSIKDAIYNSYISVLCRICIKTRKFARLAILYRDVLKSKNQNKISLVLNALENTFYSFPLLKDRADFATQISESGESGKYVELMKLYLNESEENFGEKIFDFVYSLDNWKAGYNEALFLAIKSKVDITSIIDKLEVNEFEKQLNIISNAHDDFASLVLEYGIPKQFYGTIKRYKWIVIMYECAALRCFELNDYKKNELYKRFAYLLGEYVLNIYNPELLEDETDVEVLPSIHRFGYYMLKANRFLDAGNQIGYIQEMKKALVNCESMREIVEFLLEQFKKMMGMSKNT